MNAPPDEILASEDALDKGPGQRLRETRIAAELSIEEVSARLHLDRRIIARLESDDYSQLPAPTFVRGYLRGYARLLGLPPGPIIEAFDRRGFEPPALIPDIATHSETRSGDFWVIASTVVIVALLAGLAAMWFKDRREDGGTGPLPGLSDQATATEGGRAAQGWQSQATTPADTFERGPAGSAAAPSATLGPVASAPGAAADAPAGTPAASPPEPSPAPGGAARVPGDTGMTAGTGAPAPGAAERTARASVPPRPSSAVSSATAGGADAGRTSVAEPAARTGVTAAAIPGSDTGSTASADGSSARTGSVAGSGAGSGTDSGVGPSVGAGTPRADTAAAGSAAPGRSGDKETLVMTFAKDAWVEVYDAEGERLYYDLARAGSRARLQGTAPIRVLLGYIEGVKIEYNGRPFDFSPYVSRGIARFEIGR